MNLSNGKIWPYAIGTSIMFIFGACIATIVIATKSPVEKSYTYMTHYHDADANANEIINARIAFDKKYQIDFVTEKLDLSNTSIKYKVTDLDSNIIENAKINIVLTRPNNHKYDQKVEAPTVVDSGVYSFDNIVLPVEGRWDIMAKVSVGELNRFYNIKGDTRDSNFTEY